MSSLQKKRKHKEIHRKCNDIYIMEKEIVICYKHKTVVCDPGFIAHYLRQNKDQVQT